MSRNTLAPIGFDPFDVFAPLDFAFGPRRSWPASARPGIASVKCDVKETEEGFEITADFPGTAKEDIALSLDDGVLTIAYEKGEEADEEKDGYIVKERSRVSMRRTLMLGDVNEESAKAKLEDGVLTLTIAKREPAETKKEISID